MRLLLDEMFDPVIAEQLRSRGHDVVAVAERSDLQTLSDSTVLLAAIGEGRALLTENVPHFLRVAQEIEASYGLLLTSSKSMPRRRETLGLFVRVLDAFLAANPADDALRDRVVWLTPD